MNTLKRSSLLTLASALAALDVMLGAIIIGANVLSKVLVAGEEWAKRKAEEYDI